MKLTNELQIEIRTFESILLDSNSGRIYLSNNLRSYLIKQMLLKKQALAQLEYETQIKTSKAIENN